MISIIGTALSLVQGLVLENMRTTGEIHGDEEEEEELNLDEIRQELENTDDIIEQADILQFLYKTRFPLKCWYCWDF